ncbi:hypothetical protein POSPLADRAFT_1160494 [Postia placenta MAD-698-R-SB12]|uniref:Uncharacterized protein n=1 Tax=Postia placenta MAD-698-R-SB12 TaxID=670580 RepID=A0A1X6MJ15_9APHY|nr:hypothetical protein POSPLADRAFT_1160494 [Postia placenta MAD-698-R-SB12]OSX56236.1 hypothetical protein POSPLADRAFT_1160494 [Postia placenta MAD-698-R-SB12]
MPSSSASRSAATREYNLQQSHPWYPVPVLARVSSYTSMGNALVPRPYKSQRGHFRGNEPISYRRPGMPQGVLLSACLAQEFRMEGMNEPAFPSLPGVKSQLRMNLSTRLHMQASNNPYKVHGNRGPENNEWKIGPDHIRFEDIVLVGVDHVSHSSLQAQFEIIPRR